MFRNEVYAEPLDKDNPWITFKRIDMVKLHFKDTIKMGVFAGETVKDCIMKYGRKSILEILKYYDLSEDILEEYHYKSLEHQDNPNDRVSKDEMVEPTFVTSSTLEMDEEYFEPVEEVVDDPWFYPGVYDPEDDDEFGDLYGCGNSYKPWIYGYKGV